MNRHFFCKAFSSLFIAIFSFVALQAQCPASATMVVKESRCKENGSITVNVNPAGAYTYEIISGPEVAALSSSNVFNGLGAGNYIISVHGASCSRSYNVTVPGNYQDPGLLTATTTKVICPDGTACLTADQPTNGRPPYTYSIVAGPVTRPLQSSTSFCGLPEGFYTVNALDSCGVIRTSQFSIGNDTGNFSGYVYGWDYRMANCNDLILLNRAEYYNTQSHNLLKLWYVTPAGDTLKVNDFRPQNTEDIDTLPGMARMYGTWQVVIFDECGRVRTNTFDYNERVENETLFFDALCNGVRAGIRNNWYMGVANGVVIRRCSDNSVVFTQNNVANDDLWWAALTELDYNTCYYIETFNECGDTIRSSVTTPARGLSIEGCGAASCYFLGRSRISMRINNAANVVHPVTFTITAGPSGVGSTVVNGDQWNSTNIFENLAPGIYTIVGVNACGDRDTIVVDASRGLQRNITITQTPHCSGGSNIHVSIAANRMDCYYDITYGTSTWLLPFVRSTSPLYPAYNTNTYLTSSADREGVWEADYFDIRDDSLTLTIASESADGYPCTFDTTIAISKYTPPTLRDITGYVCTASGVGTINYRVSGGVAPYRFRIKPDAASVWGAWQDSSIFTGIAPGTYDINVEDACPNGSIRSLSFLTWQKSNVAISAPCADYGSPVTLSADPAVSFVSYQWIFNNTVVGTGATYTIPSYSIANQGLYKLKQVFRGGTCIDSSSSWLLTCSILPLTLGDFKAEWNNELAVLNWTMLAGIPDMKFQVERSTNGINFSKIADVPNNGETEESIYRFTDNSPNKINYYRIAYFTTQGTVYYSQAVKLSMSNTIINGTNVSISPIPFKDAFTLQLTARKAATYQVKIHDATGKNVAERKINAAAGENLVQISQEVTGLPPGYYFVEISGDGFLQRKKILKQ